MGIPFLNKKNPINEIECCGNKTRNPQTHNHVFDDLVTHIVKLIINDCVIKIKLYFKKTTLYYDFNHINFERSGMKK